MEIRNLITDDDAVSPVIGVILMVAITVILAAVIASFVLGIGGQQSTTPAASFTFDYQAYSGGSGDWDGNVTITHDGGDSISDNELVIRGDFDGASSDVAQSRTWEEYNTGGYSTVNAATVSGDESRVVAGDRLNLRVGSAYDLSVNFEAQEGSASSTLAEDEGPDA